MINFSPPSLLVNKKNLLAFSAGVDSSALFFLLLEHDIPFDIAMVNYGTREDSDTEEAHAIALAKKYGLWCYTAKAPQYPSHFEKQARDFRYAFFEEIIRAHCYDNLLTAHQLNDRLEWFLMRLSRGAGTSELAGMEPIQQHPHYTLIRPLLAYPKAELLGYLEANNHPYFLDKSNEDDRHERNRFRTMFSDPLIERFGEGINRSFEYLLRDKATLEEGFDLIHSEKELRIFHIHDHHSATKAADVALKELGYLLSAAQRQEIAHNNSLVIGGLWAIERTDNRLCIAPVRTTNMPKPFKERCRQLGIPPKIRPYLYDEDIEIWHNDSFTI